MPLPSTPHDLFSGVSWYLRARLEDARRGRCTYAEAGWNLAIRFGPRVDDDVKWSAALEALVDALVGPATGPRGIRATLPAEAGAWNWFEEHLPGVAGAIPRRRRSTFLAGMRRAWDEGHFWA